MNILCFHPAYLSILADLFAIRLRQCRAVPSRVAFQIKQNVTGRRQENTGCIGRLDILNRPGIIFPLTESNYTAVRLKANRGVNSTELCMAAATL